MVEHVIQVALGERSYQIRIGPGALDSLGQVAAQYCGDGRAVLFTDRRVGELYGKRAARSLRQAGLKVVRHEVPVGERSKSLTQLGRAMEVLVAGGCSRKSVLVALGGGVVGDLGGFAAAVFMRGINYVQAPTTLLAAVDSSVGGKTAVNLPSGKNLVGAFHQPRAVVCDPETLRTLPMRDVRAGMAEVIKHGVILDVPYFEFIEQNLQGLLALDAGLMAEAIAGSCRLKAYVVERDERESGLRQILNYGHTFGHAIETLGGYRRFRHGEAVSVGMAAAGRLGLLLGTLEASEAERIEELLRRTGLPTCAPGMEPEAIWQAMRSDKKATAQEMRFVVLKGLGRAESISGVSKRTVISVLQHVTGPPNPGKPVPTA